MINKSSTISNLRKSFYSEAIKNNKISKREKELKEQQERKLKSRLENLSLNKLDQLEMSILNEEELKKRKTLKYRVSTIINHNIILLLYTIVIIFLLFSNDMKYLLSGDISIVFNILYIVIAIMFLIEIILSCWIIESYLFKIFFWVDVISILSLIFEIDWMIHRFIPEYNENRGMDFFSLKKRREMNNDVSIIIEILRILRLVRIVKIYKSYRIYDYRKQQTQRLIEIISRRKSLIDKSNKYQSHLNDIQLKKKSKLSSQSESNNEESSINYRSKTNQLHINDRDKDKDKDKEKEKEKEKEIQNQEHSSLINLKLGKDELQKSRLFEKQNHISLKKINTTTQIVQQGDKTERTSYVNLKPFSIGNISNTLSRTQSKIKRSSILIRKNDDLLYNKDTVMDLIPKQSTIAEVIADSLTKKVLLIILVLLLLYPITDKETYYSNTSVPHTILCKYINLYVSNRLNSLTTKTTTLTSILSDYSLLQFISNYSKNNTQSKSYEILSVSYMNYTLYQKDSFLFKDYRREELLFSSSKNGYSEIITSNTLYIRYTSIISIIRTILLIFIVIYLLYSLEKDAKTIIFEPLQLMIDVVETVAKDPVNSKTIENFGKTISSSIKRLIKKKHQFENLSSVDFQSQYEVQLIQLAIVKISALLAISFGEAGGEIIKENISSNSTFNPMLKGKKKEAIFGFCDIRKFSDINQALQERIMLLVNEVSDIIHSVVDRYNGSTNKNLGDVFLNVWKKNENKKDSFEGFNKDTYFADQALLAYLYCIHKINKSHYLKLFSKEENIVKRLGKDFKVNMGFGLHAGWGIEGAIGSMYKIDASYLSPNVNIAARLMTATKQYKVSILFSGALYSQLSPEIKKICRKIDCVKVKGSKQPIDLYTVDVNMSPKPGREKERLNQKERKRELRKKKREVEELYYSSGYSFHKLIHIKKNYQDLLKSKKRFVFYETFRKGLDFYIQGNWELAYENLKDCLYIDEKDGPTQTLIEYIKKRNLKCPDDWKGYRSLMSK